jgi:hypothetical protein
VFQVLVLVAGLENVIKQLDQDTRKKVQVYGCNKKTGLGQNNHRGAQNTSVSGYVLLFFFCDFFSNIFFIFFHFAAAHKKITHQVSVFFVQ